MFVLPVTRSFARVPSSPASPLLDRVVDHLFETTLDRRGAVASPRVPALDVGETDIAFHLAFDLPGVSREQLKVSVEGRRVSLETLAAPTADVVPPALGEPAVPAATPAPAPATNAHPRSLYRERSAAVFARTVSLPAEVDQTASQAKFENGVLTLTLAKKVPAGATQLQIG